MWDEGSSFGFQQVVALLFFTTSKSHVKLSVNRVRHHSDGMSLLSAGESNHLFIEMTLLLCVCLPAGHLCDAEISMIAD